MAKRIPQLTARFVTTHFVDEKYHKQHPHLVHRHMDVLELLYIIEGRGAYLVEAQEYGIQPGKLVICNAGTLHGEVPAPEYPMQSYCCVLRDLSIPGLPPNSLIKAGANPIITLGPQEREAVEHLMLAMHGLRTQSPDNLPVCNHLANGLLNLVNLELHKRNAEAGADKKRTEELIQNITAYLDTHYMEPFSLQELAQRFHMSHYYLAHIYKAETGVSPMRYIQHLKIGEAQAKLMNTDLPIGEIGDALGFHDNCHFSSMFKKYVGVTPTEYRQHFQTHKTPPGKDA